MKLRRVYEMAEEEGRSVEEVALERFGNLEAFEEAKEERRLLDEREARKVEKGTRKDRCRTNVLPPWCTRGLCNHDPFGVCNAAECSVFDVEGDDREIGAGTGGREMSREQAVRLRHVHDVEGPHTRGQRRWVEHTQARIGQRETHDCEQV